jgi:hypothetical protein
MGKNQQKILSQALAALENEPQIKKDIQRVKQITCCPSRYGFSIPNRAS